MNPRYKETVDFLFSQLPMYQRIGASAYKKDLDNTLALLEVLGHPQSQFQSIHIAGTNGKGSVSHMLAAAFISNGIQPGVYTSPHYLDFRERIKIGSTLISEEEVISFVESYRPHLERIKPSFFEMTVAMAFDHFSRHKVPIAIIETGLGGRLDSTNVISPILSIITQIGWDHMDMLGDTLEKIAFEKAGIIKEGKPVVIGEYQAESAPIFEHMALEKKAPLYYADKSRKVISVKDSWLTQELEIQTMDGSSETITTDLTGPFQQKNIITYLKARDLLISQGVLTNTLSGSELKNVRSTTNFIGRWQILSQNPIVLCDSAHNRNGMELLFAEIQTYEFTKVHIVFGVVQDKALATLLEVFPKEATYYFAKADVPRGMDAVQLEQECHSRGLKGKAYLSVGHAFGDALEATKQQEILIVTGSIFVVAEVLRDFRGKLSPMINF